MILLIINNYQFAMATSLNQFEQKVCNAQISHVSNKDAVDSVIETYGELYPFAQTYANQKRVMFKDVVLPQVPKKVSKADKIKWDNTIRIIGDVFSARRNVFAPDSRLLIQSTNLDLKVIGFCHLLYTYIYECPASYNEPTLFSIIISAQKFIKYLKAHSIASATDLERYCNKAIKMFKYSGATLQEKTPELITLSPFDAYIPTFPIEPYPAQKELYRMFSNPDFTQNGGLVFLSTATNSGKTFSVVGLSKRIDILRKYISINLLFSCVVDSVRDKVEELLKFANIPYGVMREEKCPTPGCQNYHTCITHSHQNLYILYDPTFKEELVNTQSNRKMLELEGFTIIKKGSRKIDNWRVAILDPETNILVKNPGGHTVKRDFSVIIAPPHLAYSYLIANDDRLKETALFLDEFTIGAADVHNSTLAIHMKLIKTAPKWTFLSNANFIGDDRVTSFLVNHQQTFANSKIYNITSSTVYTCSTIKTYDGMDVLPHYKCSSKTDFSTKLKNIMKNQFKGRMYNVLALKQMYMLAKKCIVYHFSYEDDDADLDNIKLFTDRLPDIDAIFNNVENLYPDNIRKLSIEILQVMESINLTPSDDDDDEDESIYSIFSQCPKAKSDITSDAYKGGMDLIGALHPKEYAMTKFADLLATIKSKTSLYKIYSDYEKDLSIWEDSYSKISKCKYADERERLAALSDIDDARPNLVFPEEFQIGTREGLRAPLQIANIDFLRMKNEDMVLLLFAGVGIYDADEQDKLYLQTLFSFGIKGRLAYIVSNVSYGIDYPFSKVFIDKTFSDSKSMNEVYQLLSRGGRGQMNNLAKIFISNECADKIFNVEEEGDTLEVRDMVSKFNSCV